MLLKQIVCLSLYVVVISQIISPISRDTSESKTQAISPGIIRRAALILPAVTKDPLVLKLIDEERRLHPAKRRKVSLFSIKPREDRTQRPTSSKRIQNINRSEKNDQEPTHEQLQEAVSILFNDSIAKRLHDRLNITIVPTGEIEEMLRKNHFAITDIAKPEVVSQIGSQLNCDIAIIPKLDKFVYSERADRELIIWSRIQVIDLRIKANIETTQAKENGNKKGKLLLSNTIEAAGSSRCGRAAFQNRYVKTWIRLGAEAVEHAASQSVHTLQTGDSDPFENRKIRIGILPVYSPTECDMLLFTKSNRKVIASGIHDLPSDISDRFMPDVFPILSENIQGTSASLAIMKEMKLNPKQLWISDEHPDMTNIKKIADRMRVDFILLARISDLEVQTGQAGSVASEQEIEARAEAIADLISVKDVKVIWKDRATATMMHKSKSGIGSQLDHKTITDAERFALLQLQRRFQTYRMHFEQ